MAKTLLWIIFVLQFIGSLIIYNAGEETPLRVTIISISILGVLAICESIESLSEKERKK